VHHFKTYQSKHKEIDISSYEPKNISTCNIFPFSNKKDKSGNNITVLIIRLTIEYRFIQV